jgi:hypothetical protein
VKFIDQLNLVADMIQYGVKPDERTFQLVFRAVRECPNPDGATAMSHPGIQLLLRACHELERSDFVSRVKQLVAD